MTDAVRLAVVIVTHNSQRFLEQTLASIDQQTQSANFRIAVDDYSSDRSAELLHGSGFSVSRATSSSADVNTRIAQNFLQGVRLARSVGADLVVLGDHDDVWHSHRIEHQSKLLASRPTAAMVASDGYLIDKHGAAVPGTIRQSFPVPGDFPTWAPRKQWAYALRHSLATGGSSAIRPAALDDWSIPAGWLHDRWWSLVALRHQALIIDERPVIDYRLTDGQEIGLETAGQEAPHRWYARQLSDALRTSRRVGDLTRLARSQVSRPS